MGVSAAVPEDLAAYGAAAAEQGPRLARKAGELKTALDAFRTSAGRGEFIADVPEVDLDVRFFAARWQRLGDWVAGVGQAFADADTNPAKDAVSLDDAALAAKVDRYDPPQAEVAVIDGRTVVDARVGDDDVAVEFLADGSVRVTVNGEVVYEGEKGGLVVRGNAGNDQMSAAGSPALAGHSLTMDGGDGDDELSGTDGDDTLIGGAGNDRIHGNAGDDTLGGGAGEDRIWAGAGADQLEGGEDDDYLAGESGDDDLLGGSGADQMYAGDGADTADGGLGEDYVDGGAGGDRMTGGGDDDVVTGGEGDDSLSGGDGSDVIYAGPGADVVDADDSSGDPDRVFVEADDEVSRGHGDMVTEVEIDMSLVDAITIDGTPEFQQRVRADFVTMASSPTGQQLLEGLRDLDIVIREGGGNRWTGGQEVLYEGNDTLNYQPGMQPISILYHELSHAYTGLTDNRVEGPYVGPDLDQVRGTLEVDMNGQETTVVIDTDGDGSVSHDEYYADRDGDGDVDLDDFDLNHDGEIDFKDGWGPSNFERQAVGLPVDDDQNPFNDDVNAWEVEDYPEAIGENPLRTEMGLDLREKY